jgi:microcystin-dependent protein
MSQPYIGEIRMTGFNFAPQGWAFCDGSLLPIAGFEFLFALIGTIYGGDGQNTFALPDLRGRVPLHQGQSPGNSFRFVGNADGSEGVILTPDHMPQHQHAMMAGTEGTRTASPSASILGSGEADVYARDASSTVALAATTLANSGGGLPHSNVQPFLCVNFIISLYGIFPQQN